MAAYIEIKKGKEKALLHKHHWVFSGAVHSYPQDVEEGSIVPVKSASGATLGSGYFQRHGSIALRMLSFDDQDPFDAIVQQMQNAIKLRSLLFDHSHTTAYRLINGEGDRLPGLVVDRYGDCLVVQLMTLGMERLRTFIVDTLVKLLKPQAIYEKSVGPSRKQEKLLDVAQLLYGEMPSEVVIIENGISFLIDIEKGQKTGFFLDQRQMRMLVRSLAKNKKVLNAFSYTGGFSLYALAGGASHVTSVDISAEAIEGATLNAQRNHFTNQHQGTVADVFSYLREESLEEYQLIILDPPAFAKKKEHVVQACRGYKDINRIAMQKMSPSSLLLTASCSYHVDEKLFQQVLFQAAAEAKKTVKILSRHLLAADHPINLNHPEGDYLKSFLLYLE